MASGGIRYWGIAAAALVWLASSSGAADAQVLSHSKGGGVVACITATASASINEALDHKAGGSVVRQIAFEGHCTPLPPAIGFRIVKPVQLETSSGSVDAVIGEVGEEANLHGIVISEALAGFLTLWGCRYGNLDDEIDRAQRPSSRRWEG